MLLLRICGIVFAASCGISCGASRVVFVDTSGGMVRLAHDVKGHVYFFKDGEWIRSAGPVTLPEGWFAGGIDLNENENNNTKKR